MKLTKLLFTCIFLYLSLSYIAQCVSHGDDFETGSMNQNWQGLNHLFYINNYQSNTGSFHLSSNADFPSIFQGLSLDFPAFSPFLFTCMVKSSNVNLTGSSTIILGDSLTGQPVINNGNAGLFFINFFNGNLRIIGDSTIYYPAQNNTWYEIFIDNFNWSTQTADVYIDGNLLITNLGFRSYFSYMTKIFINGGTQNNNQADTSSWDMIYAAEVPTIIDDDTIICYGSDITLPDGTIYTNVTAPFFHSSIIIGPGICDSIINSNVNLTLNQFSFNQDTIEHCVNENGNYYFLEIDSTYQNYLWNDSTTLNNNIINSSQMISVQVIDSNGCFATDSTYLNFITIDTTIVEVDSGLVSNEINANFQWLDCNQNYTPVIGENNNYIYFGDSVSQNFALRIEKNGCVDTSYCYYFDNTSIYSFSEKQFSIYPNPVSDFLTFKTNNKDLKYKILSTHGEIISTGIINENNQINVSELKKGLYFLILIKDSYIKNKSFLKI